MIRGDQHHVVRQSADHSTTLRQQLVASAITRALLTTQGTLKCGFTCQLDEQHNTSDTLTYQYDRTSATNNSNGYRKQLRLAVTDHSSKRLTP